MNNETLAYTAGDMKRLAAEWDHRIYGAPLCGAGLHAQEAEALEGSGARFNRDRWTRGEGDANAGYGITAVLEGGDLLEKVPQPALEAWQHCCCSFVVASTCSSRQGPRS